MYSVLKKVLEYRYPLYSSTGTRFKKLFFKHTTRTFGFCLRLITDKKKTQPSEILISCVIWDLDQIPSPSSSLFGGGCGVRGAGAFLCTTNRGKLLQHKLIHVRCTKKSTRVPVSPVPQMIFLHFQFACMHACMLLLLYDWINRHA